MKAIKIDVVKQDVYYVEMEKDYHRIYDEIGNGCTLFCCPVEFDNSDALYSDDEGLLHENLEGCFMMEGWRIPLVGNAIILGTDEEGDSTDVASTVEEIKSKIIFWGDKKKAEDYRKIAMNQKPVFY
jgi:hypothetical protein